MTAIQSKRPTLDDRYETLCNNVAASPGNDDHIETLGCLLDEAFSLLDRKQRRSFFHKPEVTDIEAEAAGWAGAQDAEFHSENQ